jgi:hypothetical protein
MLPGVDRRGFTPTNDHRTTLSPRSKPAFASEEGRGLQRWDRFATYTEASLGVRSSPYSLAAITHGQNRASLVELIIYHDCLLSARKGIKLNSLAPDVDAMSQSLENRSVSAVQEYFPFYFCRPVVAQRQIFKHGFGWFGGIVLAPVLVRYRRDSIDCHCAPQRYIPYAADVLANSPCHDQSETRFRCSYRG